MGGGPPIVAAGLVWTIGQNGTLYGLDPATGKVRQQASIGAVANHFPTPSVGDGLLLAPAANQVVAFTASKSGRISHAGPIPTPSPAKPGSQSTGGSGGGVLAGAIGGIIAGGVVVIGAIGWLLLGGGRPASPLNQSRVAATPRRAGRREIDQASGRTGRGLTSARTSRGGIVEHVAPARERFRERRAPAHPLDPLTAEEFRQVAVGAAAGAVGRPAVAVRVDRTQGASQGRRRRFPAVPPASGRRLLEPR